MQLPSLPDERSSPISAEDEKGKFSAASLPARFVYPPLLGPSSICIRVFSEPVKTPGPQLEQQQKKKQHKKRLKRRFFPFFFFFFPVVAKLWCASLSVFISSHTEAYMFRRDCTIGPLCTKPVFKTHVEKNLSVQLSAGLRRRWQQRTQK